MGDLFDRLSTYGKQEVKAAIKSGIKNFFIKIFTNPYVLLGIAIAVFAIFIFFAIVGGIAEIAEAAESAGEMQSATGSSWEQFKRYVATKEGGSNDGTYYFVEDDGAGNPTIGHGLCLYTSGMGHKIAFANYGIDTKQLVSDYLAGKEAKVEMSICDQIWEEDVLRPIFESIIASYEDLDLTEYQCYALTDVKYRRGNTNGFQNEYENKWTESDDQYGNYNEANEQFSTDTLFNFFWNGGHSLEGVNTRKQDQWVLFKYGYYRPLGEYWQESAIFSGDLYNDDGSVNESAVEILLRDLESYFGLPVASVSMRWQNVSVSGYTPTKEANNLATAGASNYQCTWWANVRANYYLTQSGKSKLPTRAYGNGDIVATTLSEYFNSGSTPKPNSVFSMTNCGGGYGHVAYVEAVDNVNGYYYVSHCGSGKYWHGITKVKIGQVPCGTLSSVGYVYLDSPK